MGLMDILATLKAAKDLITQDAPAVLERIAEFSDQVSKAARDAEEWCKQFDPAKMMAENPGEDVEEQKDELCKFQQELRQTAAKQTATKISKDGEDGKLPAPLQADLTRALLVVTNRIVDRVEDVE